MYEIDAGFLALASCKILVYVIAGKIVARHNIISKHK